jgi:hypothetical protein
MLVCWKNWVVIFGFSLIKIVRLKLQPQSKNHRRFFDCAAAPLHSE